MIQLMQQCFISLLLSQREMTCISDTTCMHNYWDIDYDPYYIITKIGILTGGDCNIADSDSAFMA